MIHLKLYTGDSASDTLAKEILEKWSVNRPDFVVEYLSIHIDPAIIVRLGIELLPALVFDDEVIAQGDPQVWGLSLIDRLFASNTTD